MRRLADRGRIEAFMRAVGAAAARDGRLYFTGGATAVLVGWRQATIDVDILLVPEQERVFAALPELKESLELNVELASPADFIPELPGWADRSPFIAREGKVSFHHYDFHAQILAKIERAHSQDLLDVREMLERGLVDRKRVWGYFETIEPRLARYPAIDPPSFRRAVERALGPC
jgi:hypothetical protein